MIKMNEEQKIEFDKLQALLLDAETSNEINYYSEQIHQLLDKARVDNPDAPNRFTEEQSKLYEEYMEAMIESLSREDTLYYERKIIDLIDEADKNNIKLFN